MALVTHFNPESESWFEMDGVSYSTQNGNEGHSLAFSDDTFRFEVRPDDFWAKGSPTSERSEIRGETVYAPGETVHVSYGFMIEPGADNTATGRSGDGSWLVLAQFHADDWISQPAFAIEMIEERMAVVIRSGEPGAGDYRELFLDTADIERGRYYDIDITVRFRNDDTGFIEVWRDGQKIVSYSGPIGYDNGVYWKYGIYRSEADTTIAVDYRGMSVGKGGSGEGVLIVGTAAGDEISAATSPAGQPAVTDQGDTIVGSGGADLAVGGAGNDKVLGSKGDDVLKGGGGNDLIRGGAGNDQLYAFTGNNKLMGDKGKDLLVSGAGDDVLIGGKGKDTFVFAADFGRDRIIGFKPGEDVIRFDKALFAGYAEIQAAMTATKAGVLIATDHGSVLLDHLKLSKISDTDFVFA
jgi:Ca2+-binding RTX toxin-like protein